MSESGDQDGWAENFNCASVEEAEKAQEVLATVALPQAIKDVYRERKDQRAKDRALALVAHWRELVDLMPAGNPARAALVQCAAELEAAVTLEDDALRVVAPEIRWPPPSAS